MTTTRHSAAERRDDVLDAALLEFADHGYEGASTEDIARRAGISQPYLFRLFGTKKELFKATIARCFRETPIAAERACRLLVEWRDTAAAVSPLANGPERLVLRKRSTRSAVSARVVREST